MFIKSGQWHLTYISPIILVVRVLDSQFRNPGFKITGWLQGHLSILLFRDWLNEYQELLGTDGSKSKLSPHSGSVALMQLNLIDKKGL